MPLIEVTLTLANTVYPLSSTSIVCSLIVVQQQRDNTAAIYFSDTEGTAPSATTHTGLEFVAPNPGVLLAGITFGTETNDTDLMSLTAVSGTAGQKLEVFYRRK